MRIRDGNCRCMQRSDLFLLMKVSHWETEKAKISQGINSVLCESEDLHLCCAVRKLFNIELIPRYGGLFGMLFLCTRKTGIFAGNRLRQIKFVAAVLS